MERLHKYGISKVEEKWESNGLDGASGDGDTGMRLLAIHLLLLVV